MTWLSLGLRWGMLALSGLAAGASAAALKLHVPSPDWRDQVIYFVMTDRFADGDASNNDQGAGEFKPGDGSRYQGGDLVGLRQRLPYIRGLGATALWITPPVANQWLSPGGQSSGFHGYWTEHFMKVDRHLGSLADYRRLSDALHRAGMYLVQDIVVNHSGDYFSYGPGWTARDAKRDYQPHSDTPPASRPSPWPFNLNDPRIAAHQRAGVYHWTPPVADFNDAQQVMQFQMSGLDDLNTENATVRRALRRSYGHWIRQVGVDAFRVDTAFYVPPAYFADFVHSQDRQAPGMAQVARGTGRRHFHLFGEGFGVDPPGQDALSRKIEGYMHDSRGRLLLPGMLNFPLYGALGEVFARGRPPAELGERITSMIKLHQQVHLMPSFVDNHDVDRFLAGGDTTGLQQALLAMMTLPGIPVIYYGTEQGFTEQRAAMFAAGFGADGRDHFDVDAPLYQRIAQLTQLRRTHRVFSRGRPKVLAGNAAQPGGLAYRMSLRNAAPHSGALVVFNTALTGSLLAQVPTGWAAGTVLRGLYGLAGLPAPVTVDQAGRVTLPLPPRSGQVWQATPPPKLPRLPPLKRRDVPAEPTAVPPTLDPLLQTKVTADFWVTGGGAPEAELRLVVDGDLGRAQVLRPDAAGRWRARVDTAAMVNPQVPHSVVVWAGGQVVSESRQFWVLREWRLLADVDDPAGDDKGPGGPNGRYVYPTDTGWGANRQMDLRRVKVFMAGDALRLDLTMHKLTTLWKPVNGFDHVAFTVFIELPDAMQGAMEGAMQDAGTDKPAGATVMPLQDASLPAGMRWHLRLRTGGWTNAAFSNEGASASAEGRPLSPAPTLQVDMASNTVSLVLPASLLSVAGRLPVLSGAKIYVTTWDYDGGYRALSPQAQAYAVGGGTADGPKVMDDSVVIVLP
jgi:glycosidase